MTSDIHTGPPSTTAAPTTGDARLSALDAPKVSPAHWQIADRDVAISENIDLARRIAHRYAHRGVEADDLQQVAALALVLAADRFDPARGHDFAAYAGVTIHGELKRHLRDHAWAVRPPRGLHDTYHEVSRATGVLTQSLGRSPTAHDLARHLGVDVRTVREAQQLAGAFTASSLDAMAVDLPDVAARAPVDSSGARDIENVIIAVTLDRTLRSLSPRERLLVNLRFEHGLTQQQIGQRLGISQMQVSRLLAAVVTRLRLSLGDTFQQLLY